MKLLKINEFRNSGIFESPPCADTIRRQIDNGTFPFEAIKIGAVTYINVDKRSIDSANQDDIEAQRLIDSVMSGD